LLFFLCLLFYTTSLNFTFLCGLYFIAVLLAASTKRAQYPFRSWLPKAIRAPTPVSSLVHRRTLVTAGLILLRNFKNLLLRSFVIHRLFTLGLLTIFFASLLAMREKDFKKVVALSTLSQIGFCIFTFSLGYFFLSYFHIFSHALFKRCLFILVGFIMHFYYSQQDYRRYYIFSSRLFFIQIQFFICLASLCGLFFRRGLIRKDFILEFIFYGGHKNILRLIFIFTVILTFIYSWVLWRSIKIFFTSTFFILSQSYLLLYTTIGLFRFTLSALWWITSNSLLTPSLFIDLDFYTPFLFLCIMGLILFLYNTFVSLVLKQKFLREIFITKPLFWLFNFCCVETRGNFIFLRSLEFFKVCRLNLTSYGLYNRKINFLFLFMLLWVIL